MPVVRVLRRTRGVLRGYSLSHLEPGCVYGDLPDHIARYLIDIDAVEPEPESGPPGDTSHVTGGIVVLAEAHDRPPRRPRRRKSATRHKG